MFSFFEAIGRSLAQAKEGETSPACLRAGVT